MDISDTVCGVPAPPMDSEELRQAKARLGGLRNQREQIVAHRAGATGWAAKDAALELEETDREIERTKAEVLKQRVPLLRARLLFLGDLTTNLKNDLLQSQADLRAISAQLRRKETGA